MKKWLIGASVALNALALVVVVGLWFVGDKILAKFFMEPTHTRWKTQFEVLPVKPGDIVFLGDSITEGGIWEDLFPDLPVRNRGIGGDTTRGLLKRLHQIVKGKPEKVFLLIGTNDLGSDMTPNEVAENIFRIVDTIETESPDTKIFIQSVLPRSADFRERVEELNALLRGNVSGRANWIDLYPLFLDQSDGSIRNDLSNDELHLLGEGYLLWREAIETRVRD